MILLHTQTIDVYNTIDRTDKKTDRNQPYYIFGQGWGQGNTINSNFSLQIVSLSKPSAMTIHNFQTLGNSSEHNWVNSYSSNGLSGGPWGVHSSKNLSSDGCFIYTEKELQALQQQLKNWGLHSNHQIYGTLR